MFEKKSVSKASGKPTDMNQMQSNTRYNLRKRKNDEHQKTPVKRKKRVKQLNPTSKHRRDKHQATGDGKTVRLIQIFRGEQHSLKLRFYGEVMKEIASQVFNTQLTHTHTYAHTHIHTYTYTHT